MSLADRIQHMSTGTHAVLVLGLTFAIGGAACSIGNHHPERQHTAPAATSSTTATTEAVELGDAIQLTPAVCDTWAQRVEEDEVPAVSPAGAAIVDYSGVGSGCAVYGDGFAYDGDGWHAPTEVQP